MNYSQHRYMLIFSKLPRTIEDALADVEEQRRFKYEAIRLGFTSLSSFAKSIGHEDGRIPDICVRMGLPDGHILDQVEFLDNPGCEAFSLFEKYVLETWPEAQLIQLNEERAVASTAEGGPYHTEHEYVRRKSYL